MNRSQITVLIRGVFLTVFITCFIFLQNAFAQSCNNWLSLPSYQSYVSVGDLDIPGNKITVEATFMRTTPYTGGQIWAGDLVSKHNTPSDANYLLRPNNAEITTTNGYFRTPDICEIELNKTYHAALTYDGATLRFYRNGILMSSVPATGNLFQNNFQTRIGLYDALVFNTNLIGYINEVRIWNVVRSQAQIQAFMNTSLPNPTLQAGLLAYYTFDNLLNKQGNAAWNGTLGGSAAFGQTNLNCQLTTSNCNTLSEVTPDFTIPDTVCVNTPVNISNISVNATSYYWNFCVATTNTTPSAVNLGNIGGVLTQPVFSDIVSDNGNYYVFVSNILPGGLVRLSFGNSLLNNPTVTDFGSLGGLIPNTIEGIQVVKNEGRWYAIMIGGDDVVGNIPSRILKIDFGVNINNNAPVGTNWGNIGNLSFPVDLHLFQENGVWYGFTVNANTNSVTRFNFSNSFNNIPTGVNLGNLGGLNYPTGINAIQDNGNWYVFITNDADNGTIVRLDFGNSLVNPPVAVNLGNPGNVLHKTRDVYIMKSCGEITGLAVNGPGYNDLVKLNFNNNITSVPTAISLGNTGNMNFPHSISKLFRAGNDLYTFVTNVYNNTITRIRFPGCNNSSIPNSAVQNPPPIVYTVPGTYNINLTVDEGLPTQSSVCKQIVVMPSLVHYPTEKISICQGDNIKIGRSSVTGNYTWNNGATIDSIIVNAPGIYWVETKSFGCINRDSFEVQFKTPAVVALGADRTVCSPVNVVLDAGNPGSSYMWSNGGTNQTATVTSAGIYYVRVTNNGCVYADTIIINTYAKPVISLSNDTLICKNAQAQLSASGGLNYSWSPVATLNNPSIPNPIATPSVNTKYFVTVTDVNSCQYFDSVEVSIRPDAVFGVSSPAPVCRFDSVQLSASGGDTYSWQMIGGLSNYNIANPKASPLVTTDYSVTITEATCNQSRTLVTRVTVMPQPTVNAAKANDIDCRNAQSQLSATGADQYLWTPSATLSNPSIFNPVAIPVATTQYIVTGTDANGCSAKDTINVDVFAKPNIVISDDITICKNAQAQLNVNVTGGASYSWSPSASLNNTTISNPVASPVVTTKYYVLITDPINCEYLDSVIVSVRPDPVFSVNSPGQVCKDGSYQLNASGGDIYSWQPAGGLSNTGVSNPMATPLTNTDYTVTITENTCNQSATLTTRITVLPAPIVSAAKSNDIDCSNDRSQLNATGAVQYAWSPAATLNSAAVFNPVATPSQTTDYIVEGTDALGCKGYDTISVKVDNVNKGGYLMSSAFTPNGDGLNDCYGIKYWGAILELEFSIYNRWGNRIFFTKNPGQCWDGRYKGTEQDGGVFVYVIKAKTNCDSEVFRKGTFVLVR